MTRGLIRKAVPNRPPTLNIFQKTTHHNVSWRKSDYSLIVWAENYIKGEVEGILSPHTFEAKCRDLDAFMRWFAQNNGTLDVSQWVSRDTQAFVDHLEELGRAPATINRVFATLRTFGNYLLEQEALAKSPTRGIKELEYEDLPARKLSKKEINQLFRAADMLIETETASYKRPRRNRAILALLYYTGLRVSELCSLQRNQYNGIHLLRVRRKGKSRGERLYITKQCREYLDEYIETEREPSKYLFTSINKKPLERNAVYSALRHIAEEASKHLKRPIELHPHRLRHTFGYLVWEQTKSENETMKLMGHKSAKYTRRYIKFTEQEREEVLENL